MATESTTHQQIENAQALFMKMAAELDLQKEHDVETAIALLLAFWMEHQQGIENLWSILDKASNFYLNSIDVSNREIH